MGYWGLLLDDTYKEDWVEVKPTWTSVATKALANSIGSCEAGVVLPQVNKMWLDLCIFALASHYQQATAWENL